MSRVRTVAATLLVAALAAGWMTYRTPARPAPPRPSPAATRPPALVMPHTARELLAAPVGLTLEQRRGLERLAAGWDEERARLEAAITVARRAFDEFMTGAAHGRGASLGQIQVQAAEVQELSVELRARRLAHAAAALEVLTPAQRSTLTKPSTMVGGNS